MTQLCQGCVRAQLGARARVCLDMHLSSKTFLATLGATALLGGTAVGAGAIRGTDGNDTLTGTEHRDRIHGRAGDDTIDALGGPDVVHGGRGDDTVRGGAGRDLLWAQAGRDTLEGGDGNDRLWAVIRSDVSSLGDAEGDTLRGGAGNDRLHARDGESDVVDCGDGLRDRAWVDQFDVVTGCERVVRRDVRPRADQG